MPKPRPFRIVFSEHARQAVQMWSSCSAVETQIRRELAEIFVHDVPLNVHNNPPASI